MGAGRGTILMMPARSAVWNRTMRIVPTIVLVTVVWWFSRRVDWQQWRLLLNDADWVLYAGLFALQLLTLVLTTLLWHIPILHIRHAEARVAQNSNGHLFLSLFRIQLASGLVESLTPSSKLGGEAVKLLLLRRRTGLSRDVLLNLMVVNKTVTFGSFLILTAGLLLYAADRWVVPAATIWSFLGLLTVFGAAAALLRRFGSRWSRIRCTKDRVPLFVIAAVMWALYPVKFALVANMLGLTVPFALLAVAVFAAYVVSMIPLTPGGLGSFEAIFAVVVMQAGLDFETGLLLAVATRLVTFWFPLILGTIMSFGLFDLARTQAEGTSTSTDTTLRKGLSAVFQLERLCIRIPWLAKIYHALIYETVVQRELAHCDLKPGDFVAHIGSGPYPMTALRLAEHGIHCDGFDIDPEAILSSKAYIKTRPGLSGEIRILDAATEFPASGRDWNRYRAIFISLHVTGKKKIVNSICAGITNDSKIVYRNPRSLLRRLYPVCMPELSPEWNVHRIVQPFFKESIVLSRGTEPDGCDVKKRTVERPHASTST